MTETTNFTIQEAVQTKTQQYLNDLGDLEPERLYQTTLDSMEKGLLEPVMKRCKGNQSKAAKILGINRATLRSKLDRHGIR